ncbi:MAG TPA: FG-GAP-like repeat-containing protein [Bryobacteraceae bacterium]|nr:FG-GAP-like repeat-containing protein [Bryobacteraceae bacterium]
MKRRHFIASLAAASLAPSCTEIRTAAAEIEIVRPRSPYEALLRDIEPGHDDFPVEKQAAEIAAHFRALTRSRTLPLAPDFTGASPLPVRYTPIAEGVSRAEFQSDGETFAAGLVKWLDSLGEIRSARFFVLPNDILRFEIAGRNQYRVGMWKNTWAKGLLAHFAPIEEVVVTAPAPLFRDITGTAFRGVESFDAQLSHGIPYWRARLDAACGIDVHGHNGIAVGDIDNDGRDEIYICQPGGLPNRLYRNRGDGTFEDITEAARVGVLDATSSALFVDFRNSGLQDLVVLRPDGPLLFVNQGGGRFRFQPGAFRFRTVPQGSFTGMAAADYDRDGRVDLYLCTYSFFRDGGRYRYPVPYYDARNGPPNFLFHNELAPDGSGMFADVTEAVGMNQNNTRFSFAPAWCDYNGDGWPDLIVANDFGRKNLYRNEGGKFRDVAAEAGVEDIGDGMSAAWFDYDGDGRPDLYVSNMWSDAGQRVVAQKNLQPAEAWRRHAKGNSLYRNRGDGTFEDTGAAEGVEMGRWAWSADGIDFDNDGMPEIFVTTGMLTNQSETDLESFFWRKVAAVSPSSEKSDPTYENGWNALSQAAHEQYSEAGRQANVFYVRRGGRYYDFSGVSGLDYADDSRAFAVTDLDGDGNLDLLLKSRLGPQVRVFQNQCGVARKSLALRLRGVKSNRDAIGARVEVDGKVQFVNAGSGYLSQHTKQLHFGLGDGVSAAAVRIIWPSGSQQEFRDLAAGFVYQVEEGSSHLESAPFRGRGELAAGSIPTEPQSAFADTWLLEPVPLPEPFAGPGFLHLPPTIAPDRAAPYAIFARYLFDLRADLKLPVWFLVDGENRAHKIYFAAPDATDLQRMHDSDRVRTALPFAGKYYTLPQRNYSALGAAFYAGGSPSLALRYLELSPQDNDKILFAIGKIHLEEGRWKPARLYLERGLALAPDSADGWNSLGAVDVSEGQIAAALEHFEKALQFRPDMTSALVNAGQAHLALGRSEEAEKLFRRALEIDPQDAAAANQMGELFVKRQRDGDARQWFQQSIGARRDYAPAIANLGAVYARAGQLNDAIAAFRYGIEVVPDEETFYLNLGNLYVGVGNRDAARETIERLLQRKPASKLGLQALRELDQRNH